MAENLNCMVIDDEPLALSLLSDYISKMPGLNLVQAVSNPLAAISYLKIEEIDLIFLDMQMPELNGIEFLNLLQKKCMVIVTTAYSEYALDGYNYQVIDYLIVNCSCDESRKQNRGAAFATPLFFRILKLEPNYLRN